MHSTLDVLLQMKNVPVYERSPVISDDELDQLIRDNKGSARIWCLFGEVMMAFYVVADSFDEAINKAREHSLGYNGGYVWME